jgi:head-tail adaptor
MRAGSFDRKITIKTFTLTQGTQGQEIETEVLFHECMAMWEPVMGSDRFKSEGQHSFLAGKFSIRPIKSGITQTMVLYCESQKYKIVGLAEIGRRVGLEIAVEAWQ